MLSEQYLQSCKDCCTHEGSIVATWRGAWAKLRLSAGPANQPTLSPGCGVGCASKQSGSQTDHVLKSNKSRDHRNVLFGLLSSAMSGIEIAGLVFGVVPIVVEILKSYRTAKERLNTFRKYGRVIHDVQLRYRVAATSFSNDCQLLLKAVVNDARELPEMLEDPNHDAWRDPHLEPRFRTLLAQDYKLFEDIVILIRNVLRDTQTALQECEGQTAGGDTQSAIAKRFYAAFNISRKENEYRRWLDTLDQWNNKLSELRKQRCKLHKRRFVRSSCLVRKAVPRKYKDIQATSRVLHESLQDSWSCTNISHTGHQGKLSVEGKAEYGNVRLDMVISCRENDANMDAT
jgi:hypothetical protein